MPRTLEEVLEALQSYARWTREAQDDSTPRHKCISIDDMDADLLDEAAKLITDLANECIMWRGRDKAQLIQPGDE